MKVLDVTEFFSERGGGVRSHLATKGHVLCQLGHEHVVVAPGPRGEGRAGESRLVRVGGPRMPYDPSYHLLWRPDAVGRVIAEERPEVLEIHSPYVAAAGALAAARGTFGVRTFFWHSDFIDTYRQVLLERSGPGRLVPRGAHGALTEPLWAWVRRIGSACAATIAASRGQVDKLRSHGVPNVVHLPFGVDKQTFKPRPRSEGVRTWLGVGPGEDLLVAVGRFAVEKRWDVVLRAYLALRERRRVRLVVFGDGPERAKLKAMARGVEGVRFAGFEKDRDKLADALASADALVHACPYETFGISIAEAVACGLPVVVPDEGGAAEQAEPSYAETYPSLDARGCADALDRLLSRDRASLRAAALARGQRMPSIEEHFEQLVALYASLGAGGRPPVLDR